MWHSCDDTRTVAGPRQLLPLAGTPWILRTAGDPTNACGLTVAVQRTTIQETDELPALNKNRGVEGRSPIRIVPRRPGFSHQRCDPGQADAMSADSIVTAYANPNSLTADSFRRGPMHDAAPYGWVVDKGSPLAPALQQALQRLIDSGRYREILDRWGIGIGAINTAAINTGTS